MELQRSYRIFIIVLLFFMLILVRAFAQNLFYDPFIEYFKNDFLHKTVPVFSGYKLLYNMFYRYALNMIISLVILYVAFQNKSFIKFAIKFYILAFVILIITFMIILKGELANGYLFAFYIRRFLIHPLFVLLLLPAFYYKQLTSKEIF
ncbi:MAG: exosortase F system-associated protein [Flavobacteriaceae bacterium]|nr:exosortase F system-associated protein [Flavobacteriaceae bacterium]